MKAETKIQSDPQIQSTSNPRYGDYQINGILPIATKYDQHPLDIAMSVASYLEKEPLFEKVTVANPAFINLTLSSAWMNDKLNQMMRDPRLGVPIAKKKETIIVDYSSPNIAKQMHVGHLRSTIIGWSIIKTLRFIGHHVIGDNHLGDWGLPLGLLLEGIAQWGDDKQLKENTLEELERIYRKASKAFQEDQDFAHRARHQLVKLQSGEKEAWQKRKRFLEATLSSLKTLYQVLGVEFDQWLGESAYENLLQDTVDLLVDKKIAIMDQGALCIFFDRLEQERLKQSVSSKDFAFLRKQKTPFIVQKKDGSFLYSTTDIATIVYRTKHFKSDRILYVVGQPQSLHFTQLFATARLLGIQTVLSHIGFGQMLGSDGKTLKTRSGKPILLKTLVTEAIEKARKHIALSQDKKKLRIPVHERESAANIIGIGALKYADLMQNRKKDYRFDWNKLLSFDGNAGPYLQYQYARTCSVFRQGNIPWNSLKATISLQHKTEKTLGLQLLKFPDAVYDAAEHYSPHILCEHLYVLARLFSKFWKECPVLKGNETKNSRLGLVYLTSKQLKQGLDLLGIDVIEHM